MNNCLICTKPTKSIYCSLSCSNVGRAPKNEARYLLDPKKCPICNGAIPYVKRFSSTFCSHSCSAKFNNVRKQRKPKPVVVSTDRKRMDSFLAGTLTPRKSIRKVLITIKGNQCSKCELPSVWHGQSLTMTVDHIDGNAGNNKPDNLRLLCPNCHSQTLTFCGRNRGKGRQSLGLSKS